MKFFFSLLVCCISFACIAQEPKLMLPIGHTGDIIAAQFSPDGRKIVTVGDNTAKIWDAASGLLLSDLKGHSSDVTSAKFSPDGKRIVTASGDSTLKIWDVASGLLLINLKGCNRYIWNAQFSADGKRILATFGDSTAKIWDLYSGVILVSIRMTNTVGDAWFSPDSKKIITTSYDETAKVWDANSGLLITNLKGLTGSIHSVQFSPDCRKVLRAYDSTAKIWDINSGLILLELKGHTDAVINAQFSPDSKKVITTSRDGTAKIWDINSGLVLANLKGHIGNVLSAQFSFDGKKVITASNDGTAKIWDANSGLILLDLKGHADYLFYAQFSPDGRIALTTGEKTVKIWDAVSGTPPIDLKGHTNQVAFIRFSADNKKFIMTSLDKTVKTWDAATGGLLSNGRIKNEEINLIKFSIDGKRAVTVSEDSTVRIWDLDSTIVLLNLKKDSNLVKIVRFSSDYRKILTISNSGISNVWDVVSGMLLTTLQGNTGLNEIAQFSVDGTKIVTASDSIVSTWDAISGALLTKITEHESEIWSVNFSPDSKKIVTDTRDGSAKIWNSISGILLTDLNSHNDRYNYTKFSLDGEKVLMVSDDNTIKICDAVSGSILFNLKGHTDGVFSAYFSYDSKKAITTSYDNTAKIWDLETGMLLFNLTGHTNLVWDAHFSPNGKQVVTSSRDNTCKLWNAKTGELLYTFFAVDSTDYLVVDKWNRYDGTEAARKLLYFTCGTEVISLDQVKDQLWVPNLAERIIKGETINASKLSDLNICGTLPIVEAAASTDSTVYRFAITPQKSGLGETILYVNDIEARRYTASQLLRKNGGYELTVPQKELARFFKQGEANRVTVKSFTADNSISSRGVSVISEAPKQVTVVPHLYAVMAGVSDYKGTELDLRYAAKDAADLGKAVQAAATRWFGPDHVHLYNLTTDTGRTAFPEKAAIRQTLADIGKKATPDDILLLFFAGHGVMGGKDKKQFYFLPADASNATATDAVAQVGISTSELADWMQPTFIKAQKRILILDACNSGQAINDLVKIGSAGQGYLASRSDEQAEQIKAIDKLNERSGLFVLAASASNQSAYEMSRYNQGLLTYALLKAMKQQPDILDDGRYLNVSRWFTAAEKNVTDLAKETGARQQPQIVTAGNFNIGLVDAEVMAKITLPGEKLVFTASNFQNEDKSVGGDDLELSSLLNRQLQDISIRGTANDLNFIPNSNMPDACSLQGSYEVKGTEITVHANLWRARKNAFAFVIKGTKDKLNDLVRAVITRVKDWVNNVK